MKRILHIASFLGNIGDNFNHFGTRKLIESKIGNIDWVEIEIRETFRKKFTFDDDFANYCNEFDAVIFGGGNFFELWVDHSVNNTSADIRTEIIDRINVPFYFYALGVDPGMGVSKTGIDKFIKWVKHVSKKNNFHISVRNDGAVKTLKSYFPNGFDQLFTHLVDGGFLVVTQDLFKQNISSSTNYIGLNIAGDMLDKRFSLELSYESFIENFSANLSNILMNYKSYKLLLIPHIFRDYKVIYDILDKIDDKLRRERIDVASLSQGVDGMIDSVKYYDKCKIILANRFHSNVIGLILKKNVFGLFNYRQIEDLYSEISIDQYYDIRTNSGIYKLFHSLEYFLNDPTKSHLILNQNYIKFAKKNTLSFFQNIWIEN